MLSEKPNKSSNDTSSISSDKEKVQGVERPESDPSQPRYRERELGIWTLYYPITEPWLESIPVASVLKKMLEFTASIPIVWKFILETLSLGPYLFVLYFLAEIVTSIVPTIHLRNNSTMLNLTERVLINHEDQASAYREFYQVFVVYLVTVIVGWVAGRVDSYVEPVIEQRVSLHFKKRILAVQSRLDLAVAENPEITSRFNRVTSYRSQAWTILQGLAEFISVVLQFVGQLSVLSHMIGTREDAKVFGLVCVVRPLLTQARWMVDMNTSFYAVITNQHWLRMSALYDLGTSAKFKKEVLSGSLDSFINSQYMKDMGDLGDTSGEHPPSQLSRLRPFGYHDINAIFEALPFLLFAWGNIRNRSDGLSLTSLVMIQQSSNSFSTLIWRIMYSGGKIWDLFDNVVALYEVLNIKPSMKDGEVVYPDGQHSGDKGTAIEFRHVNFAYPGTEKLVLNDLSFTISSGQLCVIRSCSGCGKSTTINLITRLYDSTSGMVLIDNRSDYQHLPLTVQENILLGLPDSKDPPKDVEEASKLGGSYDFVQRLPLKFDTNLEPRQTGFSNRRSRENAAEKYKKLVDAQKPIKLSGGEWQRLALSRTFMKNSDHVRLLCYDEPSASLDPKAEYEIFERLRNLRGEKTMIFVTHRFGHLTKHADLILYLKGGSIIEQGTHKQLLAKDGEYAKMYSIQSQAFLD
ncbi:ABC transporter [Ceratobasidium sp. AG-Ba]|nr:ABC transporter [Ceratobasidium sp. AG-Ba]QRW03943.1 ABC transporter [Ceratobasidium sp. AG-Ba]